MNNLVKHHELAPDLARLQAGLFLNVKCEVLYSSEQLLLTVTSKNSSLTVIFASTEGRCFFVFSESFSAHATGVCYQTCIRYSYMQNTVDQFHTDN